MSLDTDDPPKRYADLGRASWPPTASPPTQGRIARLVDRFTDAQPSSRDRCAKDMLRAATRQVAGWGGFLAGGWILFAATDVAIHQPTAGVGPTRTHRWLDRFISWSHAQGEIDGFRRDALLTLVDDAREVQGESRQHAFRVHDCVVTAVSRERLARAWCQSAGGVAEPAFVRVEQALTRQLGAGLPLPLGAIDVAALPAIGSELDQTAALYEWLARTERMNPRWAKQVVDRLVARRG